MEQINAFQVIGFIFQQLHCCKQQIVSVAALDDRRLDPLGEQVNLLRYFRSVQGGLIIVVGQQGQFVGGVDLDADCRQLALLAHFDQIFKL